MINEKISLGIEAIIAYRSLDIMMKLMEAYINF